MADKKPVFVRYFLMILIFAVLISGCSPSNEKKPDPISGEPTVQTEFLMGTIIKITIHDEIKDPEVFQKAFNRIAEIEDRMTINKDSAQSEIIRLNNASGKESVSLSPDTFFVLEKGKYYSEKSNGMFDITIGPLVKLWNIGTEQARVPSQSEIQSKLDLVGYKNLVLDKSNRSAKLVTPGMIVDLGAIAKGYAADEAARILREAGIKHAIVNLGGNIVVLNSKPDGTPWRLGLQDPNDARGDYVGVVLVRDQTLVSSGTYERYFEYEGKKYHHILNPDTGYPEENDIISISILTKSSIDADGLSTTTFMLGLEKGMKLIEELPDTEAIFITADKKVYTSSGINDSNFKISKNEYQLQK